MSKYTDTLANKTLLQADKHDFPAEVTTLHPLPPMPDVPLKANFIASLENGILPFTLLLQVTGDHLQAYRNTYAKIHIQPFLSQNHRMVGVGRDLCRSSSPTLLPKEGHLQQAAEDLVQVGLEYLQRSRLHNLPGQPVPVLHHPQEWRNSSSCSDGKSFFDCSRLLFLAS